MQVRWSPDAVEDLEQIFTYIQADSPAAARRIMTIPERAGALASHPYQGRQGRLLGTRELAAAAAVVPPGLPCSRQRGGTRDCQCGPRGQAMAAGRVEVKKIAGGATEHPSLRYSGLCAPSRRSDYLPIAALGPADYQRCRHRPA